ncbi:MAG: nuclear transport factor 2 family protein [Acidobacteria bacterium]|nr:nuclear transport factor 2 family protein [Acidobacteriota bacterium]
MTRNIALAAVLLHCMAAFCFAQQSTAETAVWKLEHSYWEEVKAVDLPAYRALWHPNFVGWPYMSPKPVRTDHITDWITANTTKGLHMESYVLEPADSEATENLVVVHYWLTSAWTDKDRHGEPKTSRITHTWIRVGNSWQIIGGMSSLETEVRK